jgi:shikimate dehydrogenase
MTSKQFAVLGDPIEHSLSPAIHSAAYRHMGLDWSYGKFEVHSGDLDEFVKAHRNDFHGFSVTMPLKIEAANLANDKDSIVESLGVANTLVITDKGVSAFNTDVFGITQALDKCWTDDIQAIAILGAGATARSALMAIQLKARKAIVRVYARSTTNTEPIVALATGLGISIEVAGLESYGANQDLTINTLPADALPARLDRQSGWLLDVNYADQSKSFKDSFDSSKRASGKSMLLWQAVAQIRLFTSHDVNQELPDEAGVLRAMTEALQ